jgi:hypothetical protein
MPAGRPKQADAGTLYAFAHQLYWDFKRLLEGSYRRHVDKKEAQRLLAEPVQVELTVEQRESIRNRMKDEIEEGRLTAKDAGLRGEELEADLIEITRELARGEAVNRATKLLRVPGEPDIVDELLKTETPERIREMCAEATTLRATQRDGIRRYNQLQNWPIAQGSVLPMYLSQYASNFIEAKKHPRYPKSGRPTTPLKQLWFLSRALAGAIHGVEVRTVINLVGSKRPEESFRESRAAKPLRKTAKRIPSRRDKT